MSLTALNSTTHSSRALKPRNVEMRRRIEFSASLWPFHQNISKSAIFPLSVGFCAYTRGFARVYGDSAAVCGVLARVRRGFAHLCACAEPHSFGTSPKLERV